MPVPPQGLESLLTIEEGPTGFQLVIQGTDGEIAVASLDKAQGARMASVLAEFHSIKHRVELCSGTPIEKGPDGPA